jgi:hypothetical protein
MRTFTFGLLLLVVTGSGCAFSFTFLSPSLKLHITNVSAVPMTVPVNGTSALTAAVDNPSGGKLTYAWAAHAGTVIPDGSKARYFGGACCTSTDVIAVTVKNEKGETDTHLLTLNVLQPPDTTKNAGP